MWKCLIVEELRFIVKEKYNTLNPKSKKLRALPILMRVKLGYVGPFLLEKMNPSKLFRTYNYLKDYKLTPPIT